MKGVITMTLPMDLMHSTGTNEKSFRDRHHILQITYSNNDSKLCCQEIHMYFTTHRHEIACETVEGQFSKRNLACFESAIYALMNEDEKEFWHQLCDFIENYGCKIPILDNEIAVFQCLYKIGTDLFSHER